MYVKDNKKEIQLLSKNTEMKNLINIILLFKKIHVHNCRNNCKNKVRIKWKNY